MRRHGLSHACGHVSMRLDESSFPVTPAQPPGTVSADEPGVLVRLQAGGILTAGGAPAAETLSPGRHVRLTIQKPGRVEFRVNG